MRRRSGSRRRTFQGSSNGSRTQDNLTMRSSLQEVSRGTGSSPLLRNLETHSSPPASLAMDSRRSRGEIAQEILEQAQEED